MKPEPRVVGFTASGRPARWSRCLGTGRGRLRRGVSSPDRLRTRRTAAIAPGFGPSRSRTSACSKATASRCGSSSRRRIAGRLARARVSRPGESAAARGERSWRVLGLGTGEVRTLRYRIHYPRWGVYPVGSLRLWARTASSRSRRSAERDPARPRRARLPAARAAATAREAARHTSGKWESSGGGRGEGIEFAELRFSRPASVRRVNWRASARRGRLLVSDRLPERSSDVVLFLDSLGAAGEEADARRRGSRRRIVDRGVSAPARSGRPAELRRRTGVGAPCSGLRQHYRIIDAVLERVLGSSAGATRA